MAPKPIRSSFALTIWLYRPVIREKPVKIRSGIAEPVTSFRSQGVGLARQVAVFAL
jgi:hypothetical protein